MLTVKSHSHLNKQTHKRIVISHTNRFVKDHFYHIASENPPLSFDGKFVKYLGKKAVFETTDYFKRNKDTLTKDDFQSSKEDSLVVKKKNIKKDDNFLQTTTTHTVDLDHIINAEKIINPAIFINDAIFINYADKLQKLEFTY